MRAWVIIVAAMTATGCEKHNRHGGDPAATSAHGDADAKASDPLPIAADIGTILQQRLARVDATHFVVEPYELSLIVRLATPAMPGAFQPATTRARYGLEPDDIVVSANGVSPSSPPDILAAIRAARLKGSVVLLVERKSTELALEYKARNPMPNSDLDAGIGRRDDEHYEITRRFLVRILRDPSLIGRQAMIFPASRFSGPGGYRLYARPDTVWARLGILNGDVVETVNGASFAELASPSALDRLRRASVFTLVGTRMSHPLKLEWDVVESLSPAAIAGQHLLPTRPPPTALGSLLGSSSLSLGSTPPLVGLGSSLPPPPLAPPPDPLLDSQIKRIDDSHFEIKKTLVDLLASDPQIIMRSLRIVPSLSNGKPNGVKLFAIRPNSLPTRVGLANGDTLTTVNGLDMSQTSQMLDLLTKLKGARKVTLALVRRGLPMDLEWKIVR